MADGYASVRRPEGVSVVSTDVFDTVLLRDSTTETQRFAIAADRSAQLLGVDRDGLRHLRWYAQEAAYKAISLTDTKGEATLAQICGIVARTLGMGEAAASLLREVEVDVDVEHLEANRALVGALKDARAAGVRVIALSDTIYAAADLRRMFAKLLPDDLYDAVYTSADLGRTKHDGGIFPVVAALEGDVATRVLHLGDHGVSDVRNARRAGWQAVHVPRSSRYEVRRRLGSARALPYRWARTR